MIFEYEPPLILEAVKSANRLGKVAVVGFDENEATLQGIVDGTVFGTVVQNPYEYGRKSLELLVEAAPGFQQGHVLLATVYYRLGRRELADQHKAIVDRLRVEAKEKGTGDEVQIGPTSFGDPAAAPSR